jgi:hypothetical protein
MIKNSVQQVVNMETDITVEHLFLCVLFFLTAPRLEKWDMSVFGTLKGKF